MKIFLIIILFLSPVFLIPATNIYELPDLEFPHSIMVHGDNIYISGKSRVYIYQSPDRLKKIFGEKGEGPGEFKEFRDMGLTMNMVNNKIVVSSNGKISFFDNQANFIREIKSGTGHSYSPVKNNFVGIRYTAEEGIPCRSVALMDRNRQLIKNLQKKS